MKVVVFILANTFEVFILVYPQSREQCFDVYVVCLESVEQERGGSQHFDSVKVIPNVSSDGRLTLYVTTNSTLSTNTFYQATLITTMDLMEAGSFQFCKCNVTIYYNRNVISHDSYLQ